MSDLLSSQTATQSPDESVSASPVISRELFQPMPRNAFESERISRPVLTYWQDAMKRFRKNKIGMTCFITIVILLVVGIFGPMFFPADVGGISYESQQDSNFITQNPTLGEELLVLADDWVPPDPMIQESFNSSTPLLPVEALVPPKELKISGQATVNGVTLEWTPVEGVSGYYVYRIVQPQNAMRDPAALVEDESIRSVTVTTIENPAEHSFTDSAGVNASERYVYSVVSFVRDSVTNDETLSKAAAVLITDVKKSIKLSDALSFTPNAKEGDLIKSRAFLFGTDSLGRDTFARMVQGIRVDFFLAMLIPILCLIIGIVYGSISGLAGGKVDLVMMRIIEILSTLPAMLFYIILQVVLGKGMISLIVSLTAFGWMGSARVIRGEVLRLREIEFVHASKLLGAPVSRLIKKHIAPNLIAYILVDWSGRIPGVIVAEAFLSQFGLGLEAPTASWGLILDDAGRRFQAYPMQFFLPAGVLAVALLAFYLLGDALTEALDPKLRGRD